MLFENLIDLLLCMNSIPKVKVINFIIVFRNVQFNH
jgi:hypothetical protein